jgi:hypothetical protein
VGAGGAVVGAREGWGAVVVFFALEARGLRVDFLAFETIIPFSINILLSIFNANIFKSGQRSYKVLGVLQPRLYLLM